MRKAQKTNENLLWGLLLAADVFVLILLLADVGPL